MATAAISSFVAVCSNPFATLSNNELTPVASPRPKSVPLVAAPPMVSQLKLVGDTTVPIGSSSPDYCPTTPPATTPPKLTLPSRSLTPDAKLKAHSKASNRRRQRANYRTNRKIRLSANSTPVQVTTPAHSSAVAECKMPEPALRNEMFVPICGAPVSPVSVKRTVPAPIRSSPVSAATVSAVVDSVLEKRIEALTSPSFSSSPSASISSSAPSSTSIPVGSSPLVNGGINQPPPGVLSHNPDTLQDRIRVGFQFSAQYASDGDVVIGLEKPMVWYNPFTWFRRGRRTWTIMRHFACVDFKERYVHEDEAKELRKDTTILELRCEDDHPHMWFQQPVREVSTLCVSSTMLQAVLGMYCTGGLPEMARLESFAQHVPAIRCCRGVGDICEVGGKRFTCNLSNVVRNTLRVAREVIADGLTETEQVFPLGPTDRGPDYTSSDIASRIANSLTSLGHVVWSYVGSPDVFKVVGRCIAASVVMYLGSLFLPQTLGILIRQSLGFSIGSVVPRQ